MIFKFQFSPNLLTQCELWAMFLTRGDSVFQTHLVSYPPVAQNLSLPSFVGIFSPSPTDGEVVHGGNYPPLTLPPPLQRGPLRVKTIKTR